MLSRIVLLMFASFSLHAAELPNWANSCWDGTSDYNKSASLSIEEGNFEIGLTASAHLFPDMTTPLIDSAGIAVINHGQQKLFLAFTPEECRQNLDGAVSCDATASENQWVLTNTLFIERFIEDLGEYSFATIPVPIHRATVEFDAEGVSARIYVLNQNARLEEVLHVAFRFSVCHSEGFLGENFYFPTVYFSDRLRDYVGYIRS